MRIHNEVHCSHGTSDDDRTSTALWALASVASVYIIADKIFQGVQLFSANAHADEAPVSAEATEADPEGEHEGFFPGGWDIAMRFVMELAAIVSLVRVYFQGK